MQIFPARASLASYSSSPIPRIREWSIYSFLLFHHIHVQLGVERRLHYSFHTAINEDDSKLWELTFNQGFKYVVNIRIKLTAIG